MKQNDVIRSNNSFISCDVTFATLLISGTRGLWNLPPAICSAETSFRSFCMEDGRMLGKRGEEKGLLITVSVISIWSMNQFDLLFVS